MDTEATAKLAATETCPAPPAAPGGSATAAASLAGRAVTAFETPHGETYKVREAPAEGHSVISDLTLHERSAALTANPTAARYLSRTDTCFVLLP